MTFKINETDLRKIVAEELSSIYEQVDHEGVRHVVNTASKLLKACEAFKEAEPTAPMTNATTPVLDQLIQVLEQMVHSPASYVTKPKVEPKKLKTVQLRRQDPEKTT